MLTSSTKCSFILTMEGSLVDKIDLQALYLSGTYCHKTGIRPPTCQLLDYRLYMSPDSHIKVDKVCFETSSFKEICFDVLQNCANISFHHLINRTICSHKSSILIFMWCPLLRRHLFWQPSIFNINLYNAHSYTVDNRIRTSGFNGLKYCKVSDMNTLVESQ